MPEVTSDITNLNSPQSKTRKRPQLSPSVLVLWLLAVTVIGLITSPVDAVSNERESTETTFAIIADYGTCNASEQTVADMVNSWETSYGIEFIVTAGDNHQQSGCTAGDYDQAVGDYYGNWVIAEKFWPVKGNHDVPQLSSYLAYFDYLPDPQEYYEFVEGPVHFFMIDSDGSDIETQQSWLQPKLEDSTAAWQIVFFHAPAYTGGLHIPRTDMRWDFAEWGADFVIAGHNHIYERILQNGIHYFTDGPAGGTERSGSPVDGLEAYYYDASGAMLVNATETSITFQYITAEGSIRDTYEQAAATNHAPILDLIGSKFALMGAEISFTATASDSDGDALTFSLVDGASGFVPPGAAITPGGFFTWTPSTLGKYTFDVCVEDEEPLEDCKTITIFVVEEIFIVNLPLILKSP